MDDMLQRTSHLDSIEREASTLSGGVFGGEFSAAIAFFAWLILAGLGTHFFIRESQYLLSKGWIPENLSPFSALLAIATIFAASAGLVIGLFEGLAASVASARDDQGLDCEQRLDALLFTYSPVNVGAFQSLLTSTKQWGCIRAADVKSFLSEERRMMQFVQTQSESGRSLRFTTRVDLHAGSKQESPSK
jgi:hypothetical protein